MFGMLRRIRAFMTPNPLTIADHQSLAAAHRLMREHHVRHLPVLSAGKLVGVISLRDLYFIETLPDVDPESVLVSEAMSSDTFTASPDTPLTDVVREMAENKYGSVVLVEDERVVGVFTTIDALRTLLSFAKKDRPRAVAARH
jgi:acetoin utilization protein AcuB